MANARALKLFEGFGLELEYMIVRRAGLDVYPVCDQVLAAEAGSVTNEVEHADINWSNELVLHVVELKTSGPAPALAGLAAAFQRHLGRVLARLAPLDGRLMPTACHPWMDPVAEMRLWPHDYHPIYRAFNRIFDCRGHGWANLQSLHINLPFQGDDEFGRLHAAIRLLLPLMPALAASSPVVDATVTGVLDRRLMAYKHHCDRIPSLEGQVIPEPVFTIQGYHDQILARIYRDLAPYDPEGVLQEEWANARGAIARFERNAIEIRVLDVQECPRADLAIAGVIIGTLKLLVSETWGHAASQQAWPVAPLAAVFQRAIREGEAAVLDDAAYLRALGWTGAATTTAGAVWRHLAAAVRARHPELLADADAALDVILDEGPLARRLLRRLGPAPDRARLAAVYGELCDCLATGAQFHAPTPRAPAHV